LPRDTKGVDISIFVAEHELPRAIDASTRSSVQAS
jgi:hypothetical protein